LAQYCDFADLKEEMLRDRIVVGVKNRKLSEKLQLNTKLTLDTAVTMVRQFESVQKQELELQSSSTGSSSSS
jgi:plasmid maintenance system antidote protein VapI